MTTFKLRGFCLALFLLLLLPGALSAVAVADRDGLYSARVQVTLPDRSRDFDGIILIRGDDVVFTAISDQSENGIFVVQANHVTDKGRYWISPRANPDEVEPWVDSFDANLVSIRTTLFDPLFGIYALARPKTSKELVVLEDSPTAFKYRQTKKGMHVDSSFTLDAKGRVTSFLQDLTGQSLQTTRIRETRLSNYDDPMFPNLPQKSTTKLILPVKYSDVQPRPIVSTSSVTELLSREDLPKDFSLDSYVAKATDGLKDVTVNYQAKAMKLMPPPAPPRRIVPKQQVSLPETKSMGPNVLYLAGSVLMLISSGLLFLRKR
ncbi:hypothetical protein IT570_12215 [Candidatus Sumerlaeota bacterium]|nr:hypothetical protein [Candidatus Sumerlaeota bacterium]